ncbi:MAG: hypothetical protein M5U23_13815 [Acidimicrobiia bacterium]|nr:hypothetical protein [Acidimicrobiia bacterium]
MVRKTHPNGEAVYEPTDLADQTPDESTTIECGYLMVSQNEPWPAAEAEAGERLPDEWKEVDGRIKYHQRKFVPQVVRIDKTGSESEIGTPAAFVRAPFKFCLSCGISYGGRASSEFSKLGTLGSEGRSTATTLLTMSAIRSLRATSSLPKQAQKVLSFTDNRQDASLQAGHFNDFVQVIQQRGALLRALRVSGSSGLVHDELPQQVFDALGLEFEEYARTKDLILHARDNTNAAVRDVLSTGSTLIFREVGASRPQTLSKSAFCLLSTNRLKTCAHLTSTGQATLSTRLCRRPRQMSGWRLPKPCSTGCGGNSPYQPQR